MRWPAVVLALCACGDKSADDKKADDKKVDDKNAADRFEGRMPITFGDCAPATTRFVSGPRPLPFPPDLNKLETDDHFFGGLVGEPPAPPPRPIGSRPIGPTPGSARPSPHKGKIPSVSIGQPTVEGDLDKAIIRRYIKRNMQRLEYCYEKRLEVKPDLEGTVQTQFFIGPEGRVTTSTATGVDSEVANCVAGVIKDIEFPKPKGGGGVRVNYPLTFHRVESGMGRGTLSATPPSQPPPPPDTRPSSEKIDPSPLGRPMFRPASALPTGGLVYSPRATPLRSAPDPLEECLRRGPEHFGVIVVEKSHGKVVVHGIEDQSARSCVVAAIAAEKSLERYDDVRCPLVFGQVPVDRMPGFDVGSSVSFLGKQIITTSALAVDDSSKLIDTSLLEAVTRYRAAAVADTAPVVAIHGPLVIRADDAAPMGAVMRIANTALNADDDFVFAVKRGGAWQLLDEIDIPPVPLGTGGRWSRLKTRYRPPVRHDDERVTVSVVVGKDRVRVTLSRVGVMDEMSRDAVLAKLKEHKASSFFGPDRRDIEIAATNDARYGDFVAIVDAAVKAGFTDWQLTDEVGLAAPPWR
jgi:biopolymer transport protein ExbD